MLIRYKLATKMVYYTSSFLKKKKLNKNHLA